MQSTLRENRPGSQIAVGIPCGATCRGAQRSAAHGGGGGGGAGRKEGGEEGAAGRLKFQFVSPGSPRYKEHLHPQMMAAGPNTDWLTPKAAAGDSSAPPIGLAVAGHSPQQTLPPWPRALDGRRLTWRPTAHLDGRAAGGKGPDCVLADATTQRRRKS